MAKARSAQRILDNVARTRTSVSRVPSQTKLRTLLGRFIDDSFVGQSVRGMKKVKTGATSEIVRSSKANQTIDAIVREMHGMTGKVTRDVVDMSSKNVASILKDIDSGFTGAKEKKLRSTILHSKAFDAKQKVELFSRHARRQVTSQVAATIDDTVDNMRHAGMNHAQILDRFKRLETTDKLNDSLSKMMHRSYRDYGRRVASDAEFAGFRANGHANFTWVTVNRAPTLCPDCSARHGVQGTAKFWQKMGKPGSGRTVCSTSCYCSLMPKKFTDKSKETFMRPLEDDRPLATTTPAERKIFNEKGPGVSARAARSSPRPPTKRSRPTKKKARRRRENRPTARSLEAAVKGKMSGKKAAEEILKGLPEGVGLSADDIVTRAREAGLWSPEGKTPGATLAAALGTDIKKKGASSLFVRVRPGQFGLRANNPGIGHTTGGGTITRRITPPRKKAPRRRVAPSRITPGPEPTPIGTRPTKQWEWDEVSGERLREMAMERGEEIFDEVVKQSGVSIDPKAKVWTATTMKVEGGSILGTMDRHNRLFDSLQNVMKQRRTAQGRGKIDFKNASNKFGELHGEEITGLFEDFEDLVSKDVVDHASKKGGMVETQKLGDKDWALGDYSKRGFHRQEGAYTFSDARARIRMDTDSPPRKFKGTLFHEWMHHVHHNDVNIQRAIKEHFEARTKRQRRVRPLPGYRGFRGKKDKWYDNYAGVMNESAYDDTYGGFEMVTRYSEPLVDRMAFAKAVSKDLETVKFLMGILDGAIR